MTTLYLPAKLLVCLVGRGKGEHLMAVCKTAGARGGTIALGRSVGDNPILQALSLADVSQDMLITILGDECDAVLDAVAAAAQASPKKLGGLAVLTDISGVLTRNATEEQCQKALRDSARRETMEASHELISVIVNAGVADDVMAQARKAGAAGGTIVSARGTGTADDVKFFGITLVPEKEILMIVAAKENVPAILDAVKSVPKLREPGGGIVFSSNVERFMTLGGK